MKFANAIAKFKYFMVFRDIYPAECIFFDNYFVTQNRTRSNYIDVDKD
jgi:hypothetical protein